MRKGERRAPTELTIRAATPADGEGMRLVHVAAIGAVDPSIYPDEIRGSWAYGLRAEGYAYSMSQGEDLEVAIDGSGRILAFCGVKAGEVTGLYVHPDAQGAGLGTALLRRGEARAKARKPDADSLSLNASLNAVSFHERHGFVLVSIHERRTRRKEHGGGKYGETSRRRADGERAVTFLPVPTSSACLASVAG